MKDGRDKIQNDLKDYIEDYDISSELSRFGGDDWNCHSYELDPAAIKFYFSKDLGNKILD